MRLQFWKQLKTNNPFSLSVKCAALSLLLLLSVLIVSCGNGGTDTSLGNPDVTVTIDLGAGGSPTPPLPAYSCNAWVTNTTPGIYTTSIVDVYAKFTQSDAHGNPVGVGDATATATVLWPDGNTVDIPANSLTTSDGLAIFPVSIANRSNALNKITLVTVHFLKGNLPCDVKQDQAAFFTLVSTSPVGPITTVVASPPHGTPIVIPSPMPDPTVCVQPPHKKKCH